MWMMANNLKLLQQNCDKLIMRTTNEKRANIQHRPISDQPKLIGDQARIEQWPADDIDKNLK